MEEGGGLEPAGIPGILNSILNPVSNSIATLQDVEGSAVGVDRAIHPVPAVGNTEHIFSHNLGPIAGSSLHQAPGMIPQGLTFDILDN